MKLPTVKLNTILQKVTWQNLGSESCKILLLPHSMSVRESSISYLHLWSKDQEIHSSSYRWQSRISLRHYQGHWELLISSRNNINIPSLIPQVAFGKDIVIADFTPTWGGRETDRKRNNWSEGIMAKLESMTKHSELRNSNYTKKAHKRQEIVTKSMDKKLQAPGEILWLLEHET